MKTGSLKKHVVITGGAGFVGSHLSDAFLARGYAVTAIDCFVTGSRDNLKSALGQPDFDLVEWNVSRSIPELRMRLLAEYGLHGVLHFAGPASPVDVERIPFDILEVESLGTMNAVDLALRHHARLILASTSEIYGEAAEHPQSENAHGHLNTTGPRSCYDEAKRFAEAYVATAMRGRAVYPEGPILPLDAAIARIFYTYGPRMRPDDGRVVSEACVKALAGAPIPISGDGEQTRSLCYISDLVEGIVRLFESKVRQPVNLGNTEERTVREIVDTIRQMTASTSPIEHVPARLDDPRRRCPDLTLARTALGWKPEVSLREGLAHTLLDFQNRGHFDLKVARIPLGFRSRPDELTPAS